MDQEAKNTGAELERWVADAYRVMGARVTHNIRLEGNQIDVYVELEVPDHGMHRIAVEAKDHTRPVGVKIVNDFAQTVDLLRRGHLINEGVIVSNSGFSREARDAAQAHCIRLLERADLKAIVAWGGPLDTSPVQKLSNPPRSILQHDQPCVKSAKRLHIAEASSPIKPQRTTEEVETPLQRPVNWRPLLSISVLNFLAGMLGYLVAAWIQQDLLSSIFSIPRIGVLLLLTVIALVVDVSIQRQPSITRNRRMLVIGTLVVMTGLIAVTVPILGQAKPTFRTEPTSTLLPVSSTDVLPTHSSPTVVSVTDSPDRAVAKRGASLFVAPDADSTVLGGVSAGEEVRVLGRSAVGEWFYVCDDQNIEGYVYAPWFEWTGEYEALPAKVPRVTFMPDKTPTPSIVPSYPPLEMDLWDNLGTGRCYSGGIWDKSVYIQGRGGNGVYTYYWNGEKLIGPTSESHSFDVHSVDAAVIGTAKVVSRDGQVLEREHYVRVPDCAK